MTLMMTSAQVVEIKRRSMSPTDSPSRDYSHPDDQTTQTTSYCIELYLKDSFHKPIFSRVDWNLVRVLLTQHVPKVVIAIIMKSKVRFNMYCLLTKLARSRWLDIGLVLFFACLWTSTLRPLSRHLDRASLVNKGFII